MSTIKAANIQNPSAASAAIVLDTSGNFSVPAGTVSAPGIQAPSDSNTGIFFPAADTIAFAEGGAEAMRIDSSSRLLVGTSTARDKFNNAASGQDPLVQFEAAGTAAKDLYMLSLTANNNSTSSNAGVSLMLARSNGTSLNSYDLVPSGNCIGQIRFQAADGSELVEAANISAFVDGTSGANDMPGRLVFSVTSDGASSPTEAMRISNTGFTSITAAPTTSQDPTLKLTNNKNVSGDFGFTSILGSNCNNTSSYHAIFTTGASDKYYIFGNGTAGAASDNRLKKNIETTRDGYLDDVKQLRVVKYNWNDQEDGEPKELGVIAQELEQVFPGLIQEGPEQPDGNHYKAVKTSVLPFILLKALQEATAKIETLEAEVAALKAQ